MVPEDFVLSWDYVEDTAANIRRAMEHGEPGEEYIIASEPRSMVDVLSRAEDLTGISPPPAAPPWVFTLMGYGMQGVELVTRPPEGLESEVLQFFATGPILVDNSKAKADLGIEHRPFEERLETYLDWELDQQDLDPPNSQLA
jgi:dihydroflavonol-4-reductase